MTGLTGPCDKSPPILPGFSQYTRCHVRADTELHDATGSMIVSRRATPPQQAVSKMTPEVYAANAITLTAREERFCREYVIDNCGLRAAVRAGYSPRSAAPIASAKLTKHNILARISELRKKRNEEAGVSAVKVLLEMSYLGHYDVGDLRLTKSGNLSKLTPIETRRAIVGIEVERIPQKRDENGLAPPDKIKTKVRFHPKTAGLTNLANHMGLLSTELPPLEVLLNRLPPKFAARLRHEMANHKPAAPNPTDGNGQLADHAQTPVDQSPND